LRDPEAQVEIAGPNDWQAHAGRRSVWRAIHAEIERATGTPCSVGVLYTTVDRLARFWADRSAIYLWLYFDNWYFDNWTWGHLDSPGARSDLLAFGADLWLSYLTLSAGPWTAGFVLGSLSRSTASLNATLFAVILFVGTAGTATMAAANGNNAAVFSDAFYRTAYPILVRGSCSSGLRFGACARGASVRRSGAPAAKWTFRSTRNFRKSTRAKG
jgi:hypothetical protein